MFPKSRVPCRLSPQIIVISLIDKPPCRPIQTGLSPCSYSLTSPQQMPLTNSIIVYMQLNNILNIIFTFRDKTTIISDVVTSQQAPTKNCVLPSTNIPNWTTTMMRLFISPPHPYGSLSNAGGSQKFTHMTFFSSFAPDLPVNIIFFWRDCS